MKVKDLFENITPVDLKRVELALDKFVYQPEDKIKARDPVLDVFLPTSNNNHFVQRLDQRADKAGITLGQVYNLIKRAKEDSSLGYTKKLDDLSKQNDPEETVVLQDKDGLTIPVIIKANPDCTKTMDGNPVCKTANGLEPRNRIIPKTVYRKGVED